MLTETIVRRRLDLSAASQSEFDGVNGAGACGPIAHREIVDREAGLQVAADFQRQAAQDQPRQAAPGRLADDRPTPDRKQAPPP
jgi:hypothetical protein